MSTLGRPRMDPKNKSVQTMISLKPKVKQMLKEQAQEEGLSMSGYVERLVLEKNYLKNKSI